MFAAFIVGCGTTHLMEVVTSYVPLYRLSGLVKVMTAIVSVGTALLLIPLVPKALALRSPLELEREIEERKHVHRELEIQTKLLREQAELLDLAHDSIMVRDLEDRITFWNQGAAEHYGWSKEEAIGQITHTLLRTEFPEPKEVIREKLLREGRWDGELTHTGRTGRRIIVASRWALRRDGWGNPIGVLEINRDITARKKAEAELQRVNSELEHRVAERTSALRKSEEGLERRVEERTRELQDANDALEAFGYSVSHDLRTPLRNMQFLAQALEEDYGDRLDAGGKDFCRRIAAAAQKMDTLISDLLAYSRISRSDLPLGRVDLNGVVAEARSALAETIRTSQAQVTVKGPLPPIFGHRTTLVQVATNLLANAVKFVALGVRPEVCVRAEERDGFVRLWVEDNGIGIASEHKQRIFNVFERLHGEETYPGTGIGLAIVRKGIERTGGRVGVDSQLGRGSRFWVDLPQRGGKT